MPSVDCKLKFNCSRAFKTFLNSQASLVSTDSTVKNKSSSCLPYPANLKSLEECCQVPILFDDEVFGTCEFICSEDKKDSKNPDCPVKCLFENNGIVKKKVVNRTAIEWTYDKFGLAYPLWKNVTSSGLDKCVLEYDDKPGLKEKFELFEKCMSKHYQVNCVQFKEPVECDAVEDFMEKCHGNHENCEIWPTWIVKLPEYCCPNRPELFSKEMKAKAEDYCSDQQIISNLGKMQCLATYSLNATGIRSGEKWDFTIALKMLNDHESDPKWKSIIEKTIKTCENQVHGLIVENYFVAQKFNF